MNTQAVGGVGTRRWWPVALGLLGAVFLVLAAAFLFDRRYRPTVGVEPLAPVAQDGAAATQAQAGTGSVVLPWTRVGRTPLEREVEDAYARYWQVVTEAYKTLDTSKLPQVVAGVELEREERQIRALASQGRAARLSFDHNLSFDRTSSNEAVLFDELVNRSVFVDLATGQDMKTNTEPEIQKVSHQFRKIDGTWKIVDGAVLN
ncbi:MAG TPA: hypothetical protein VFN74_00080 [Chloroflexota bacterium]|nr:hypothetical protein [Chloroflexota bacterium]